MNHNKHNHHLSRNPEPEPEGFHGSHSEGGHQMKMYFHGGFNEIILFEIWKINSIEGLIGSMVLCFLMAFFYELVKLLREIVLKKYRSPSLINVNITKEEKPQTKKMILFENCLLSKAHYLSTFLYVIQVIVSYFLMLIVMTFNSWLCAAVIIGVVIGHFTFGWYRFERIDVTDHCY